MDIKGIIERIIRKIMGEEKNAIEVTTLKGDVVVERHQNVGGNQTVNGTLTAKGDLRVEGRLLTPNVIGPDKGLYESLDALKNHYPCPDDGWHAMVGTRLPAQLYRAQAGVWVYSGTVSGEMGEEALNKMVEELEGKISAGDAELGGRIEKLQEDIKAKGSTSAVLPFQGVAKSGDVNLLQDGVWWIEDFATFTMVEDFTFKGLWKSGNGWYDCEMYGKTKTGRYDQIAGYFFGSQPESPSAFYCKKTGTLWWYDTESKELKESWDDERNTRQIGVVPLVGIWNSTDLTNVGDKSLSGVIWLDDKKMFVYLNGENGTTSVSWDKIKTWPAPAHYGEGVGSTILIEGYRPTISRLFIISGNKQLLWYDSISQSMVKVSGSGSGGVDEERMSQVENRLSEMSQRVNYNDEFGKGLNKATESKLMAVRTQLLPKEIVRLASSFERKPGSVTSYGTWQQTGEHYEIRFANVSSGEERLDYKTCRLSRKGMDRITTNQLRYCLADSFLQEKWGFGTLEKNEIEVELYSESNTSFVVLLNCTDANGEEIDCNVVSTAYTRFDGIATMISDVRNTILKTDESITKIMGNPDFYDIVSDAKEATEAGVYWHSTGRYFFYHPENGNDTHWWDENTGYPRAILYGDEVTSGSKSLGYRPTCTRLFVRRRDNSVWYFDRINNSIMVPATGDTTSLNKGMQELTTAVGMEKTTYRPIQLESKDFQIPTNGGMLRLEPGGEHYEIELPPRSLAWVRIESGDANLMLGESRTNRAIALIPKEERSILNLSDEKQTLFVNKNNNQGDKASFVVEVVYSPMIAEAGRARMIEMSDSVADIEPNVLHVWGEMAELTLTLAEGKEGIVNEYMIEFISGAEPTRLSLPAEVQFPYDPEIEANRRYQISIVNNFGVMQSVEA